MRKKAISSQSGDHYDGPSPKPGPSGSGRRTNEDSERARYPEFSEPVAKRTRSSIKSLQEPSKMQSGHLNRTVLDIINDDCWRMILDYVSVDDVLRSETVCNGWRDMLHRYLRAVRLCIRIKTYNGWLTNSAAPLAKSRIVIVGRRKFKEIVEKFGSYVVAADCQHDNDLMLLETYCPDLVDLTWIPDESCDPKRKPVPTFRNLRYLYIHEQTQISDMHISNLFRLAPLKELKLSGVKKMTGTCLKKLQTGLESLQIYFCQSLNMDKVVTAADRLKGLTKLVLSWVPNAYKLINLLPELKYIELKYYSYCDYGENYGLLEAICALKKLTHLSICVSVLVTDIWLERIARSCGELRALDLRGREERFTTNGLLAFCRIADGRLNALGLTLEHISTFQVIPSVIAQCSKLQILILECYKPVTPLMLSHWSEAAGRHEAQRDGQLKIVMLLRVVEDHRIYDPEQRSYPNLVLEYTNNENMNLEKY